MAKILILSPVFPYPLKSGGQVRLFHIVKCLTKQNHQVSLLTFMSAEQRPYLKLVQAICHRVETVPGRIENSLLKRIMAQFNPSEFRRLMIKIKQSLNGMPYHYYRFAHPEMNRLLRCMMAEENYDFVQAEYSQMSPYLMDPAVQKSGAQTILVEIDVSFVAADRTSRHSRGLRSLFYRMDTARMLAYHKDILPRVSHVIAMSDNDAEIIRKVDPQVDTCVVPNGVDVNYYQYTYSKEAVRENLLFVGGSGHPPNVDAIEFFSKSILPKIQKEFPDISLTVIGEFQKNGGQYSPALQFPGFVEDLRPYMARHAVFVVPLRIGSGTRLKILEAFAAGIPVVSTQVGAEGIQVQTGKDILLADSPEEFAKAVLQILLDHELSKKISEHARKTAVSLYSWDKALSPLENLYAQSGV